MVKRIEKDCFNTLLTGGNPVQRSAAVAESGRHIPDRETNSRHYIYPPAAFTGWPRLCSGSASTDLMPCSEKRARNLLDSGRARLG